jgi:hypothetical protein
MPIDWILMSLRLPPCRPTESVRPRRRATDKAIRVPMYLNMMYRCVFRCRALPQHLPQPFKHAEGAFHLHANRADPWSLRGDGAAIARHHLDVRRTAGAANRSPTTARRMWFAGWSGSLSSSWIEGMCGTVDCDTRGSILGSLVGGDDQKNGLVVNS